MSPRTRNIGWEPDARCKSDAPTSSIRLKKASILAISQSALLGGGNSGAIIRKGHMSQASIGDRAPDFELVDLDGRWRRLSDALVHGPVVLVFFTSTCPTCEFTFPFLEKIFAQVGHKADWTLWGVSQEETAETSAFKERFGITFDLLIDEYPYPVSSA